MHVPIVQEERGGVRDDQSRGRKGVERARGDERDGGGTREAASSPGCAGVRWVGWRSEQKTTKRYEPDFQYH